MRFKFATLFMALFLLFPAVPFASAKKHTSPATATSSSQSHKSHHSKKHSKSKKSKRTKPTKRG